MNRERWIRSWSLLGVEPAEGSYDELVVRYSEPHRAYHTLRHIEECFAHLDHSGVEPVRPGELELALWIHDVVYDTRASDSEDRSAEWGTSRLARRGVGAEVRDRVHALVMATRHDASPTGPDQQLLVDVDLSILGAPEDRFDEYEVQVRAEYEWVPEDAFRQARTRILREFLDRDRLYHTEAFRGRLEARARSNLSRSLRQLDG